jgi:hypothetical protein
MKRLILDFYRRKAWILGLGAIAQLALGWGHAAHAGTGKNPFASFQLQIGIFMGAFLLALDLRRGFARVIATLPLTARQIGLAWWLATVGISAAGFTVLLLAGAATRASLHPELNVSWPDIFVIALSLQLWMGVSFTMVAHTPLSAAGPGPGRVTTKLTGIFWGLLLAGGFFFFNDLDDNPLKLALFTIFGVGLSIVGWFRARNAVTVLANFRLVAVAPTPTTDRSRSHRPSGIGGIPRLILKTTLHSLALGFGMLAMMSLAMVFGTVSRDWNDAVEAFCIPGFVPFWFIMLLALLPVLSQLRLLRTLPLDAARLAGVLITLVALPIVLLGAASLLGTGLFLAPADLPRAVQTYALALIPALLSLPFMIWLGTGLVANIVTMLLIVVSQILPLWLGFSRGSQTIPPVALALITTLSLVLAYSFVWQILRRSTRVFRPRPNPFAMAWGGGR